MSRRAAPGTADTEVNAKIRMLANLVARTTPAMDDADALRQAYADWNSRRAFVNQHRTGRGGETIVTRWWLRADDGLGRGPAPWAKVVRRYYGNDVEMFSKQALECR